MSKPIRVVIIDDVSTHRQTLNIAISDFIGVECVGEFSDGVSGLKGIQELQPDLVFLDVEMPIMNGIQVLTEVTKKFPQIGVIMVSGFDRKQADITVRALELGALDFVPKPAEATFEENIDILKKKIAPLIHIFSTKRNLERVRQIAGRASEGIKKNEQEIKEQTSKAIDKTPQDTSSVQERIVTQEKAVEQEKIIAEKKIDLPQKQVIEKPAKKDILFAPFKIDLLAIGTSTGGPYALAEVIPKLPADFPVPILIVQHMPPNFTASLANSLSKKSNIPVYEAKDGDVVTSGKVLLAPGGYHMVLKKQEERLIVKMLETPPVHGCRPSVDVLFKSIAQNYSGNVLSLIMTGMGSDGTDGVRSLKTRKCYCLIQDEESSVVFGMPKMVMQAKLSDEIIPLKDIAQRITEIVKLSK